MTRRPRRGADLGVTDARYLDLLDSFLTGALPAGPFRRAFLDLQQVDARVGDDDRYAILQRVFFACEDLVLADDLADGEERDGDEIDEGTFRSRVRAAARDLSARDQGRQSRHGG